MAEPTLFETMQNVIRGNCRDPFAVLGMHREGNTLTVRAFLPEATRVVLIDKRTGEPRLEMVKIMEPGVFEAAFPEGMEPFPYQLDISWGTYRDVRDDPYSFGLLLQEMDTWLISEGKHLREFEKLGAHPLRLGDTDGVMFAVWAPNAKRVAVVGDFNFWDGRQNPMRLRGEMGVWEIFLPSARIGQLYKFELLDANDNIVLKSDPFAFSMEMRPNTASQVIRLPEKVRQMEIIDRPSGFDRAISIYEVHLGSWRRNPDNTWLSYRQLARRLIPYVREMGFTHIELLPVMEHPFDGSWGYQPIGLFAPTSRFGSAEDFAEFIAQCHENGISVILDWVPGHFPEDNHGLRCFDGTALYEYSDPREGFHTDWNTLIYNYNRYEVKNYLLCNAYYWMEQYGIDGLRFDAVASMIYRDYSRRDGEWIPNKYGGKENLEAIEFLRETNRVIGTHFPSAVTIAEESTDFAGVTMPPEHNGLGFHYKWNMGWMHDTLNYFRLDPIYRRHHHDYLTFGMLYAYSENYVLPISHDEVVHGKGSLIQKMAGDVWQRFANLRAFYGFMWAFPGKKLLFMGSEFAQWREWNHDAGLDWFLLEAEDDNPHRGVQLLVKDLNRCYRSYPAFHEQDTRYEGFNWLIVDDRDNSVLAFDRVDQTGDTVIVICNLTPAVHHNYRVGIREPGVYRELINTDSSHYGGSNVGNLGSVTSEQVYSNGREHSLSLTLPPLATLYLVKAG